MTDGRIFGQDTFTKYEEMKTDSAKSDSQTSGQDHGRRKSRADHENGIISEQ